MKKPFVRAVAVALIALQAAGPLLAQTANYEYRVPIQNLAVNRTLAPSEPLTGSSGDVQVEASVNSLFFGAVQTGTAAPSQFIEVRNTGPVPAPIGALHASDVFPVSGTCDKVVLPVGGSCFIEVSFTPAAAQSYRRTVAVPLDDGTANAYMFVRAEGTGTLTPPSASFAFSGASLPFGSINNGSFAKQSVLMLNDGSTALTAPSVSIVGPNHYTATHDCPASLAPGESCAAEVTFAPSDRGTFEGYLRAEFEEVAPRNVALSGTSVGPVLSVNTANLDFGAVSVQAQKSLTVVLSNSGDAAASLTFDPLPEGVTHSGCGAPLAGGTSCTLTLTYAPLSAGLLDGTVVVRSAGTQAQVQVSGSSDYYVQLELPPPLTTYQNDTASAPYSLRNLSATSVTLTAVPTITGGPISIQNGTCTAGAVLPVGGSCSGTIYLSGGKIPTPAGAYTATVSVTLAGQVFSAKVAGTVVARDLISFSGSSGGGIDPNLLCHTAGNAIYGGQPSQYVCLAGASASYVNGTASCTTCGKYLDEVQLSSLSLNFGPVTLGQSASQQVSLVNGKTTDVTVSAVSVSGSTAYSASSACTGATLTPGADCVSSVTYTPSSSGSHAGKLTLTANTVGSPFHVQLSGTGQALDPQVGAFSLAEKGYGEPSFVPTPPSSLSSGAWTYQSSNTAVATVAGNTITLTGVGTTTITANQAASGYYGVGTATATLVVSKGTPVVSWSAISVPDTAGATVIGAPTSSSSGAWTYSSSDSTILSVTGNTMTPVAQGSVTLTATQAATSLYNETTVTTTVTVIPGVVDPYAAQVVFLQDFSNGLTAKTGQASTSSGSASVVDSGTAGGNELSIAPLGYVNYPSSPHYYFTGDFTIEGRTLITSGGNNYIFDIGINGFVLQVMGTGWSAYQGGYGSVISVNAPSFPQGTRVHFALTRQGNTVRLFLNGQLQATSVVYSALGTSSGALRLGNYGGGGNYSLNGRLDDFRITNGVARYTANFVVPGYSFY